MLSAMFRCLLVLFFLTLISDRSDGQEFRQWCVVDIQTPDDILQKALDWACGPGGANCTKIQPNQPCFLPNTLKDHASYAFNNYWQKFKSRGASCYFNAAAMTTELDPSYKSCHYEFIP